MTVACLVGEFEESRDEIGHLSWAEARLQDLSRPSVVVSCSVWVNSRASTRDELRTLDEEDAVAEDALEDASGVGGLGVIVRL